jgi:DNA-binding NarL/FixJ family response regulator
VTRPRILLADDHVLVAQALEHLLQAEFDVVGTVSDGRALVEAAGKLAPDVVVVDIGMPLLNGLDAGAQLKTLHPEMKVIYLTQNREPRFAIEAFRRQASGYLLKDSAASELTTAIRDALGGRTYVSPLIARGMVDEASSPPVDQIALRQLSGREREVLQLLAEGKSMKEVAGAAEVEGGEALRGQVARCHDHVEKHDVVGIGDVEDRNRAARRPLQADECIGATGDIEERYAFRLYALVPASSVVVNAPLRRLDVQDPAAVEDEIALRLAGYCRKTWCTNATAIDPSPTADATRLTLPPRTSPTAKIPGRLVSSRYGRRASGQFALSSSSGERSGPVLTNPFSSRTTQPWSHPVFGTAPVMMKRWRMS